MLTFSHVPQSRPAMSNEEYMQTQQQLLLFAELLTLLNLRGFLDRLDRAESVGPVLDPTLYQHARGYAGRLHALAEEALAFQQRVGVAMGPEWVSRVHAAHPPQG